MTCTLVDGDADLMSRSRKQIELAIEELKERRSVGANRLALNARVLGRFLRETDQHGEKLRRQIQFEREAGFICNPNVHHEEKPDPGSMMNGPDRSFIDALPSDGTVVSSMPWLIEGDDYEDEDGEEEAGAYAVR